MAHSQKNEQNVGYATIDHYLMPMAILLILCIYGINFYFIFTYRYNLDFSSLYVGSQTMIQGLNPYQDLLTTYQIKQQQLPANLNPPALLWFIQPFTYLQYMHAVIIWSLSNFIFGLIGAAIAFHYAFPSQFLQKNRIYLFIIYLAAFSTITCTIMVQLGTLIVFLAMLGYHYYLKRKDLMTGILWGLLIAIKLFPGLLFCFALAQKRYRVFVCMFIAFFLFSLFPLITVGDSIYNWYFFLLRRVIWYGDSWNASLYGFLFRLFIDTHYHFRHFFIMQTMYIFFFCLIFLFYLWRMRKFEFSHQSFCFTLVIMLLLSPLGWQYYFPLLIFPLSLTWWSAVNQPKNVWLILWFLCLFLLNFPLDYQSTSIMQNMIGKLSLYSFHFYGLFLLALLLYTQKSFITKRSTTLALTSTPLIFLILFYGVFVVSVSMIMRYFNVVIVHGSNDHFKQNVQI